MLIYRFLSTLLSPLIFLFLFIRLAKGKEDKLRFKERFGFATQPRPNTKLIWLHAVSVGEVNSSFALISELLKTSKNYSVLLTTTTLTSAKIVAQKLPEFEGRVIHQFLPVDVIFCVRKFLKFWQPRAVIFMESEIWPNMIIESRTHGAVSFLVNARMSEKSFRNWSFAKKIGFNIFDFFALIFVQKKEDQERFKKVTEQQVFFYGNLKSQAEILRFDESQLSQLKSQIGTRPTWLASNTHKGEEEIVVRIHNSLKQKFPNLLTILVPRHPNRAEEIKQLLQGLNVAQRSQHQSITSSTEIYLADTLGELGIFYRLVNFTFLGGSFVDVGGHNPYEPAKLGCAVISGKKVFNAKEIFEKLTAENACVMVDFEAQLKEKIAEFLQNPNTVQDMSNRALRVVNDSENIAAKIVEKIDNFLLLGV
jgi:3-deoxy-D-manno-octulosonic-acid transferase